MNLRSRLELLRRRPAVAAAGDAAGEGGFTLIELMVVLLIMGILMAIAIPTFLGVTGNAKDKGAQSDLTNAMLTAKTYYEDNQSYAGISTSYLHSAEPEIAFVAAGTSASSGNSTVMLAAPAGNAVLLTSWSPTGVCWGIVDNESGNATTTFTGGTIAGVSSGENYGMIVEANSSLCTVANMVSATWKASWPPAPGGK